MKKYVVMHDYGTEGWQIVGEYDEALEAVNAREANISSAGGRVVIFEYQDLYDIYRAAGYERDRQIRDAKSA